MDLPFSLRRHWRENWHVHRPSARPARTTTCLSTFSRLRRRSTTNRTAWGMEESGSATAASSSRIWSCRCLWTFQTTVNRTWRGRLPWGRCSHAAVASALMFSWFKAKLVLFSFLLKAEKDKAGLIQTVFVSAGSALVSFSPHLQIEGPRWLSGQFYQSYKLRLMTLHLGQYKGIQKCINMSNNLDFFFLLAKKGIYFTIWWSLCSPILPLDVAAARLEWLQCQNNIRRRDSSLSQLLQRKHDQEQSPSITMRWSACSSVNRVWRWWKIIYDKWRGERVSRG